MRRASFCLIATFCLTAAACGAGPAEELPPLPNPGNGTTGGGEPGTNGGTPGLPQPPAKAAPSAPMIDPVSPSSCGTHVAVRGIAEPGTSVFVVGGAAASGIATDAHPTSGRFCLDIELKPGQLNTLEVRAQNPDTGTSDPTLLKVEQSDCKPDDAPKPTTPDQPKSTNVAQGQPVKSKDKPKKNSLGYAVDGKSSTYVEVGGNGGTFAWSDYNGWVQVDLGKLIEVQKIIVKFTDRKGSGDKYPTKYKVLVSSLSDPGAPHTSNGKWIEVGSTGSGDGGTDTWNTDKTRPLARYVALWLQQDGKPHWKENLGLPFSSGKYEERFKIAEIQVWNVPPELHNATPPVTENTCAAIGDTAAP